MHCKLEVVLSLTLATENSFNYYHPGSETTINAKGKKDEQQGVTSVFQDNASRDNVDHDDGSLKFRDATC